MEELEKWKYEKGYIIDYRQIMKMININIFMLIIP